jgi:hypothetical protein
VHQNKKSSDVLPKCQTSVTCKQIPDDSSECGGVVVGRGKMVGNRVEDERFGEEKDLNLLVLFRLL